MGTQTAKVTEGLNSFRRSCIYFIEPKKTRPCSGTSSWEKKLSRVEKSFDIPLAENFWSIRCIFLTESLKLVKKKISQRSSERKVKKREENLLY